MSLTAEKREHIIRYILEQIYYDKKNIVSAAAGTWEISKTTVSRYIDKLISDEIIVKNNTRKSGYALKEIFSRNFAYAPKQFKLEEDRIFERDIWPLLCGLPENVMKIWNYAFCEIMNNAIEHSEADRIDVLFIRNSLFTRIFIMDNGVGIFEKIKKYILQIEKTEITIEDAMAILFVGKMTTNKENHSGEGIFFTSRTLDEFNIFSSNRIFVHDAYDKNESANIAEFQDSYEKERMLNRAGTFVTMELWNDTKRELREVFDMFSSSEKGFYKTQIPIKNVIPSGFPVSRSQARRLCSGFDKFEEIELDFNGVDDIAQAFAHEIFIVFKNNHPDIKIRIKNANANVKGMIERVQNTAR